MQGQAHEVKKHRGVFATIETKRDLFRPVRGMRCGDEGHHGLCMVTHYAAGRLPVPVPCAALQPATTRLHRIWCSEKNAIVTTAGSDLQVYL